MGSQRVRHNLAMEQTTIGLYLLDATCTPSNHDNKIRYYHISCGVFIALFSHWIVSDSLRSHGLQHAKLPCPSLSPRVCSNSHPLSWWCNLTIASSATPFSFCLQSFPASGSFQWVSSLHLVAKVLEFQLQHQSFQWIFRVDFLWLDWFGLFVVQGILKSLLQHQNSKA